MKLSIEMKVVLLTALAGGAAALSVGCHQGMALHMDEGERLHRAKCASCHRLIAPHERTPEQWHLLLEHHGPKRMTDAQRSAILEYLTGQEQAARLDPRHDQGSASR